VTSQIVRDWMVKFNAYGPDGLIDRKAPGQPSRLNDTHLAEMATAVAPSAHAVLLVDQAGWHLSDRLLVPPNITLLPLPAKCPELNQVENIWQFIRDNGLSNRVFRSERDIVDHCCNAWNKLFAQPWRIISIGLRDWAHRFRSPGVGMTPIASAKRTDDIPLSDCRIGHRPVGQTRRGSLVECSGARRLGELEPTFALRALLQAGAGAKANVTSGKRRRLPASARGANTATMFPTEAILARAS
jgi:transposase